MKKVISLVLCLALIMVASSVTVSAQQITRGECYDHDDCSAEVVTEVPVTLDMLQVAQNLNVVPGDLRVVTPLAKCKHKSRTDWNTIKSALIPPTKFGKCATLYEYQIQYCKKCKAAFARERSKELKHVYIGVLSKKKCMYCGDIIGIMSLHENK